MKIKPIHDHLPILARTTVALPEEAYRIVTVLNQQLKERGLVFGLRLVDDDKYEFSIYDLSGADPDTDDGSIDELFE